MSLRLVPGGRVPLPKHQLLRVLLGWDASRPDIKLAKSCVSLNTDGRIVDILRDFEMTKDGAVLTEEDYLLDLQGDTGLTYVFGLHTAARMEEVKSLSFAVVNMEGELFARFDMPAQFGYCSVALGAISYRNEWRVRALGVPAHAPGVIEMLPVLKAAL